MQLVAAQTGHLVPRPGVDHFRSDGMAYPVGGLMTPGAERRVPGRQQLGIVVPVGLDN